MKGILTPTFIWALAVLPLVLAVLRARKAVFVALTSLVGVVGISAWVFTAGYGWRISENMTSSLDGHVYIYKKGESFARGDLVAYRWRGGATYPRGTTFIKQVVGMPGDLVKREGNSFWVGEHFVGIAKPVSKAGVPLEAAQAGVIAPGEYFVATPSPDSLDSRYAMTGNVKAIEVIGKAYVVF